MNHGAFISFEGGEGAGKSTQIELLKKHLTDSGYTVVTSREPGGTSIGEQIRAITHNPDNINLTDVTEAYLMAAARAQNVREKIKPALRRGEIVISDRFVDSTIAYQGYGRNLGHEVVAKLNELALDGVMPQITFYLNVDVAVGNARRGKTDKKDRLDMQKDIFYQNVERGYKQLIKQNPDRYVVVDGNKSIDDIEKEIWPHVEKVLPPINK